MGRTGGSIQIAGQTRRVRGEVVEVVVLATREDLGIAQGESSAAFSLERTGHDRRPARSSTGIHLSVDKRSNLVGEANGNLAAHGDDATIEQCIVGCSMCPML